MSTGILQKFEWKNFIGGEGDGFYQGPAGSYRSGANLETRKLENGVMVCNKLTVDHTYTGTIKGVSKDFNRCYCTLTTTPKAKIYYNGSYKFDMATGTIAHDVIMGWGAMKKTTGTAIQPYGISATNTTAKIHRFDADLTGVSYSVASFTPRVSIGVSSHKIPTINIPDGILFGYAGTIYYLDTAETLTEALVLPFGADILEITEYQNLFRIYYNLGNNSYICYWNGVDTTVEQTARYFNSPIIGVVGDGAYDYATMGDGVTIDFYKIGGLQRQQIRNNIELSEGNSRFLYGELGIQEGIVYISGQNKDLNNCLYSYGSYIPGTQNSLVPENLVSADIARMSFETQSIYLYMGGNVYKRQVAFKGYCDTSIGSITSFPIIGNIGLDTEKEFTKIYVGYKLYSTSDTIKIYVRCNASPYSDNTGYTLIKTITGSITTRQAKITSDNLIKAGISKWNQAEFRVDIQNSSISSSIFFGLRGFYNDNPGE